MGFPFQGKVKSLFNVSKFYIFSNIDVKSLGLSQKLISSLKKAEIEKITEIQEMVREE